MENSFFLFFSRAWGRLSQFYKQPKVRGVGWPILGILTSIALLVASEVSFQKLMKDNVVIDQLFELSLALSRMESEIITAETGLRGYLLTNDNKYLDPYHKATKELPVLMGQVQFLAKGILMEDQYLLLLRLVGENLGVIEATMALYINQGIGPALSLFNQDIGRAKLEEIHAENALFLSQIRETLNQRNMAFHQFTQIARYLLFFFALFSMGALFLSMGRNFREIRRQAEFVRETHAHKEHLKNEVKRRTLQLSELTFSLQAVQEQERALLARELHDEMGGILTSLKMILSLALRDLGRFKDENLSPTEEKLKGALINLDKAIAVKRGLIEGLRPSSLQHLGLAETLRQYLNETCKQANIECTYQIEDISQIRDDVMIGIYRVVQESITNILKHARATYIEVSMKHDNRGLILLIRDNGKGFDPNAIPIKCHGLTGMQHRILGFKGELIINTQPQAGTTISVFIPAEEIF